MKAIGYFHSLPISDAKALVDLDVPIPKAEGRDLLVKIEAISVNPVDTKIRRNVQPSDGQYKILGWDAAGVVEAVGGQVKNFRPGDKVWYAGAIDRPDSNAEYQRVDERIVANMPNSLTFSEAAALPLTSITAWELLFHRLQCNEISKGSLLIIGAAGGVGSILIQLAKQRSQLSVIASASRKQTQDWVQSLGADYVVDHSQDLSVGLKQHGFSQVDYIASLTHTDQYLDAMVELIAPQGKIAVIDDPPVLDIKPFKRKSVSFHWEFMFTRSQYETEDIGLQGELLAQVAAMIDEGSLRSTVNQSFGAITAENLLRAHAVIESGRSTGKIVLAGFESA